MMVLSAPALFWSGSEFFVIAWNKLKHFSANMDTLVALSTGTAFTFSVFNTVYPQYFLSRGVTPHVYYESAVIIITLILLGRYLEEKAKSKTSSAIKKLMGLKRDKRGRSLGHCRHTNDQAREQISRKVEHNSHQASRKWSGQTLGCFLRDDLTPLKI